MSEQLKNKQDGAIRLFGALSGVDEKYLAACENEKKQSGVVVFMHKYGKAMAAVLCLAVLGAGYVTLQTGVKYSADGTAEAPQAVAGGSAWNNSMDMEAAASEAPAADAMEESVLENAGETNEKNNSLAAGSTVTNGVPEMEKGEQAQDGVMSDLSGQFSDMVDMTLAEARALNVVGQYIPTDWPTAGELSQVLGSEIAGAEAVTLFWTYGDNGDGFFVKIDNLGNALPDWVAEEIFDGYIVNEEDFTKEYVESQINDDTSEVQFGILYKTNSQYVLVRFNGRGNADEIWELMN